MDKTEALLALKLLSKEEFAARTNDEKVKKLGLSPERQELLYSFLQGETSVSVSCQPDIEAFLLKTLSPEIYWALPREAHPYSSGNLYEYDPAKNGQNIIKHGIGFGEVVSYSKKFGVLSVPLPGDAQGERRAIFSDLDLMPKGSSLELPPLNAKTMNTVMSIVQIRSDRFRFISSRLLSPNEKDYRKEIKQALREVLPDPEQRNLVVDRCIEIVEEYLIKPAAAAQAAIDAQMSSRSLVSPLPRPTGVLSGPCYDALLHARTLPPEYREKNYLGFLSFDGLDGLARALPHIPAIALNHDTILVLLNRATTGQLTEREAKELRVAYDNALDVSFPTTQAFLRWCWQFSGLSRDHSLDSISLPRLRQLEEASLVDTDLRELLNDLLAAFGRIRSLDDGQGFRQAYEFYGEALVYSLLSAKFKTRRIVAGPQSMPDFACALPNGKEFFVELKSLDIVDGPQRAGQIREDSMQQQMELERQVKLGARVAIAEGTISPFKRAHSKPEDYDPRSLLTVIDTFIEKSRSAFKSKQFTQGPTFAFALCDRLLIPGGKHSVAPQYQEMDGHSVSGVLWHVCFGLAGQPISRISDIDGASTIEGNMSRYGLLSDPAISFPTGALIFADTGGQEEALLGLYDAAWSSPYSFWTAEDTKQVVHTLCSSFNDSENTYGHLVATR